ncbi:MAG: insulinase family protein [Candidatus Eremiobacteraeota bacterium]|nr:insulinase family protein [Candidatus Eremiobacteraeota bacterium]
MTRRLAHPLRAGRAIAFGIACAATALAGCASVRPEQALAVARADGQRVSFDSATSDFVVDGVRVILRPNYGTSAIAVNLYLLGGTRQLSPATQGMEALLLSAGEYGSAGYPGARQRQVWGHTGAELALRPGDDWTLYGFRALGEDFDTTWNVWADRLLRPTLAESDVALARGRLVGRLRSRRTSPDGLAFLLADSVAYAGHPYALRPEGTESSLAALDSAALRAYATRELVTSRLLIVVVGNAERAAVEAAVRRTFGTLPHGDYHWVLPPAGPRVTAADAKHGAVAFVSRPLATNYVLGVFQGPSASASDEPAFRVATALLGSRLHQAVRERRGLSYAAQAPFLDRGTTAAVLYVSTTAPRATLEIARAQLDSLHDTYYPAVAVRYFTDQFVTDYLSQNMTSAAQADFLARAQLYQGDYRKATHAMATLRGLSGSEIRAAATRYLAHPRFVYLGDTTRVGRAAFANF